MSTNKRRIFNEEFKREAIKLLEEKNYTLREASDSLGVSQHSLSAWRKEFGKESNESGLEKENQRR